MSMKTTFTFNIWCIRTCVARVAGYK